MDEIGLKVLEHSNMLKPVSLALLKDEDPSVVCQAIISGMKFFDSILQDLVQQFIRNGKVERWAEEMWMRMIEFKDAILSLIFEPVYMRTRLLALKFLETYILVFTPDAADTNRLNSGGKERRFNVSWLPSGHPVLDPEKLISEANSLFSYLLDMLKSSNRILGPLTVTVVNCCREVRWNSLCVMLCMQIEHLGDRLYARKFLWVHASPTKKNYLYHLKKYKSSEVGKMVQKPGY